MNILMKRGVIFCATAVFASTLSLSAHAANAAKSTDTNARTDKNESRFPTGCTAVGYKQSLKVLSLFPGKEGALQSMYFFYNKLPQSINLYQMRDQESEYSTRFNHTIKPNSWAVLAVGEPQVKFICTLGDAKSSYGKIVDCGETVNVCEYVNVKFGLNNKGNFWIVDSNSRNGAVSQVVHYGIIPGV